MINSNTFRDENFVVVVPAAGVGKRMRAKCPKQYLIFLGKTLLEHTVERLLSHPKISKVIIALGAEDEYFPTLPLCKHPDISTVLGGAERVDSVLAGLKSIDKNEFSWVLVHDAARPCVTHFDIDKLINACTQHHCGGLLASPVRDTMKRATKQNFVQHTEQRSGLWHALTPQMYQIEQLTQSIENALFNQQEITDESSAIELSGFASRLIEASNDNIKITRPDDLALAEFILIKQQKSEKES